MSRTMKHLLFVTSISVLLVCPASIVLGAGRSVFLNEIMAANGATVKDPQGEFDDWIELYNPSSVPVDAGGLYLTDDPATPTKWQIPTSNKSLTTIPAWGFLLVWADGDTQDSGLHTSFGLDSDGDALYLFDADGHTMIDSVEFGRQALNISYGRYPDATGNWQFLLYPMPGMSNTPAYQGVVSDPTFSHEHGFHDGPFEVTISCATPDALIYYTTDGSEPYQQGGRTPTGIVYYTQPIRISQTTCLRAVAVKQGWVSSRIQTQTYLFAASVLGQSTRPAGFPTDWKGVAADYGMNLSILSNPQYGPQLQAALLSIPSMSIVMNVRDLFDAQTGIYSNSQGAGVAWERPGSIELIHPNGTAGFQVNCGVRMQGGAFRSSMTSKHSFRLLFKGAYGSSKLRYPLFGDSATDEFETIVLRAGANDGYAWSGNEQNATYTRDQFMRDLQLATGHAAPHGRFVHLYVNGLYWGLYNPCERPDAAFSASYYGGQEEDWDTFKHKNFTLSQGDRTALNLMLAQCQQAGQSYEAFLKLQGKNPDGTVNPAYPCLLDLPNYVDYMIVNYWGGNWDWPWNNYWLGRSRTAESTGFKFYNWDAEDVMLTSRSPLSLNCLTSGNATVEVGQPHTRLKSNPEYQLFFADRVHRLFFNGGVLTPDLLIKRYTDLSAAVEKSIILEAARWGDMHGRNITPQNWTSMRDRILTTYLPQRTAVVLGQFRTAGLYPTVDAPVFYINGSYQHGGHTAASDSFSAKSNAGTIYYTLDGSDPRLSAQTAQTTNALATLVAENASKRVLVPTAAVNNAWRGGQAFDDSSWTAVLGSPGGIGYERSTGYETLISIDLGQQMYGKQQTCYVRIPFTFDRDPASLDAVQLRARYDDGFVAYLNGVEVARRNFTGEPIWNSGASAQNSDTAAVNFEDIPLLNAQDCLKRGANVLAIQALNQGSTSSDFLLSVMLVTSPSTPAVGGTVATGTLRYADPITLSRSVCVKSRTLSGTTWSALNEAVFAVGPVAQSLRVSELMYHPLDSGNPNDPNTEFIELTNSAGQSINLNLVRFTNGIDYTFPSFELPAGSYCLIVKDLAAFEAKYGPALAVVGQYTGSLSNSGERVELVDAVGTIVQSFEYRDDWHKTTDGIGFSLTVRDPRTMDADSLNDEDAWQVATPSPGRANP